MICDSCQGNNVIMRKNKIFCPGCGWTGSILDVLEEMQRKILNLKQAGPENNERDISTQKARPVNEVQ